MEITNRSVSTSTAVGASRKHVRERLVRTRLSSARECAPGGTGDRERKSARILSILFAMYVTGAPGHLRSRASRLLFALGFPDFSVLGDTGRRPSGRGAPKGYVTLGERSTSAVRPAFSAPLSPAIGAAVGVGSDGAAGRWTTVLTVCPGNPPPPAPFDGYGRRNASGSMFSICQKKTLVFS